MTQAILEDRLWRVDKGQTTGHLEPGPDAWPEPDLSELRLVESLNDAAVLSPEPPRGRSRVEAPVVRAMRPAQTGAPPEAAPAMVLAALTPERTATPMGPPVPGGTREAPDPAAIAPASDRGESMRSRPAQLEPVSLPDPAELPALDDLGLPPLPDLFEGGTILSTSDAAPPPEAPVLSKAPVEAAVEPIPADRGEGDTFTLSEPPLLDGLSLDAIAFETPVPASRAPAGTEVLGVPGPDASLATLLMPAGEQLPGLDELSLVEPNLSLDIPECLPGAGASATRASSASSFEAGDEPMSFSLEEPASDAGLEDPTHAGLVGWSDPVIPPVETPQADAGPVAGVASSGSSDSGLCFEGGTPIDFVPPELPGLETAAPAAGRGALERNAPGSASSTYPPVPPVIEMNAAIPPSSSYPSMPMQLDSAAFQHASGSYPPASVPAPESVAFQHASGSYPPAPASLDSAAFRHASGSYPPPPAAPPAQDQAQGARPEIDIQEREKITLTPTGSFVVTRAKKTVALHELSATPSAASAVTEPEVEQVSIDVPPEGALEGDALSKTGLRNIAKQAVVRNKRAAAKRKATVRITDPTGTVGSRLHRRLFAGAAGAGLAVLAAFVLLEQDMLARWLDDVSPAAEVAPAAIASDKRSSEADAAAPKAEATSEAVAQKGLADKMAAELGQAKPQGEGAPAGSIATVGGGTSVQPEARGDGTSVASVDAAKPTLAEQGDDSEINLVPGDPNLEVRIKLRERVENGKFAIKNSDYSVAVENLEAARELARDLNDQRTLRWLRGQLGKTYMIRGELIMRDSFVTWEDCRLAREDFLKASALGFDGERCQANLRNAEACTNRHLPSKKSARR